MRQHQQTATEPESVADYEEVIRSFEGAQAKLELRRASASPSVLVHLDRTIELNNRTLSALRHALKVVLEKSDSCSERRDPQDTIARSSPGRRNGCDT